MPIMNLKEKINDICSYDIEANDKYECKSFNIEILTQVSLDKPKSLLTQDSIDKLNDKIQLKVDNVIRYFNITGYGLINNIELESIQSKPKSDLKIVIVKFNEYAIKFNTKPSINKKMDCILQLEDIIFKVVEEINSIENVNVVYSSKRKNK